MTLKVLEVNGVVTEVLTALDDHALEDCFPADLLAQAHDAPDNVVAGWKYADGAFSPPVEPEPSTSVPETISDIQAKIQLRRMLSADGKKTLLDDVTATVAAAGSELQFWFDTARYWNRSSVYVEQIGLTGAQLDQTFKSGAVIRA